MSTPVLGSGRGFMSTDGVVRRKENDQTPNANLQYSCEGKNINPGAVFTPGDSILDRLLADVILMWCTRLTPQQLKVSLRVLHSTYPSLT